MISKKNRVLIFEPKIFLKNTLTDQNLTFAFKKHEIFGGVLSYGNMRDFFLPRSEGQRMCKCKYLIIHSPQGFSGIIYNTGWGTLPDCLRCSLQVLKE